MKQWVNFRAVKNSVTMEQALARYSILLKAAGADIIRGRCPLPMHESEAAFSFSVIRGATSGRVIPNHASEAEAAVLGKRAGLRGFDGTMLDPGSGGSAPRSPCNKSIVRCSDTNASGINRGAGKRTACFPAH